MKQFAVTFTQLLRRVLVGLFISTAHCQRLFTFVQIRYQTRLYQAGFKRYFDILCDFVCVSNPHRHRNACRISLGFKCDKGMPCCSLGAGAWDQIKIIIFLPKSLQQPDTYILRPSPQLRVKSFTYMTTGASQCQQLYLLMYV